MGKMNILTFEWFFWGDTYGKNYEATMGNKTMGKLYGETTIMVKLWE